MSRSLFAPLKSLRGRWLIVQTIGLALILIAASWIVYSYSREVILSELAKGGTAAANIVRTILAGSVPSRSQQIQDLLLQLRAGATGIREVFIVDRDGIIVAHNDPARAGASAGKAEIFQALRTGFDTVTPHPEGIDPSQPGAPQGEHLQIIFPVHGKYDAERKSAIAGAVVLDVDIAAAGARIKGGFYLFFVTLGALLSLFLVAQYLALRGSYRRLVELGQATIQFGNGHYDVRLDTGGATEITRLETAFNGMAARVEQTAALLYHAKQKAEQAAEAKSQFLANMTHEIRTPLTSIIGYANLAAEDLKLSKETGRYIGLVAKASNGLRLLIDDILDLGKVESGQVAIHPHPFAARDLVDVCVSIADGAAKAKGLSLSASCDAAVPAWLVGDSARIRQVLLNLVFNAVKFTSTGSVKIRVAAESLGDGEARVRFTVQDTGIGIDDETRPRLFHRFVQGNESISRRFGGSGLGLAVSKGVVTLMGGEIGVDSRIGDGSTFWFSLPLKLGKAPAIEAPTTAMDVPSRRLRILVVDDNEMNRDLVCTMLVRAGQDADIAIDGADAIRHSRNNRYDVIFMDVRMPGIDGIEATRQIRASGGNTSVPIVAMTANIMPDQIALYRAAGMNDFVGKPLVTQDLLRVLNRWCKAGAKVAGAAEPGQLESPVHDPATLQTIKGLLGDERTSTFLGNLRSAIANLGGTGEVTDREATAKLAHSLVSLSGQLGFIKLSNSARGLETACLSGQGIDGAMAAFARARDESQDVLNEVLQAKNEPPAPTDAKAAEDDKSIGGVR